MKFHQKCSGTLLTLLSLLTFACQSRTLNESQALEIPKSSQSNHVPGVRAWFRVFPSITAILKRNQAIFNEINRWVTTSEVSEEFARVHIEKSLEKDKEVDEGIHWMRRAQNLSEKYQKVLIYFDALKSRGELFEKATKHSKEPVRFFANHEPNQDAEVIRMVRSPKGHTFIGGLNQVHHVSTYEYEERIGQKMQRYAEVVMNEYALLIGFVIIQNEEKLRSTLGVNGQKIFIQTLGIEAFTSREFSNKLQSQEWLEISTQEQFVEAIDEARINLESYDNVVRKFDFENIKTAN